MRWMPDREAERGVSGMPAAEKVRKQKAKSKIQLRDRVPTKQTINFATVGVGKVKLTVVVPLTLFIIAAAAGFGKFMIADRLSEVNSLNAGVAGLRRELAEGYAEIESYGELNSIYAHYTYSGNTEAESAMVDRVEIMNLLERIVMARVNLLSWSVSGNQVNLSLTSHSLQNVRDMVKQLTQDDMVDNCTIGSAVTIGDGSGVSASVTVRLRDVEREAMKGEKTL